MLLSNISATSSSHFFPRSPIGLILKVQSSVSSNFSDRYLTGLLKYKRTDLQSCKRNFTCKNLVRYYKITIGVRPGNTYFTTQN